MKNFYRKNPPPPHHHGFTLVEALIAVSIFTLAAVIASNVLVDIVQLEKRSSVQNAIDEDVGVILQQLTRAIQSGTVDYEEYYNMYVIQDTTNGRRPFDDEFYGVHYGVYTSRFYNPGRNVDGEAGTNPQDLGVLCSVFDADGNCEIFNTHSSDLNTGQHPFDAIDVGDQTEVDAFCDGSGILVGRCGDDKNIVEELFLIDSTGREKTIIARKRINSSDFAVGMVEMEGRDLDQNGIIDTFACKSEYECYGAGDPDQARDLYNEYLKQPFIQNMGAADGVAFVEAQNIRVPRRSDRDIAFDINTSQFLPISPLRANVRDLRFIINPVEDPYKAYSEQSVQAHPSVTILMTVGLSEDAEEEYPGDFQDIVVQTTVAAGVIGQIDSYPPVTDVLEDEFDRSWICEVLPGAVERCS